MYLKYYLTSLKGIPPFTPQFSVMASLVVLGSFFMVIMVVIDIVYAFIDPRIKATVVAKHRKKLRQKAEEERV